MSKSSEPIVVHFYGSPAIKLHMMLQAVERFGGHVRSRLVSEEDVSLIFTMGPLDVHANFLLGPGDAVRGAPGDSVTLTYDIHITHSDSMDPEIKERFKRGS